MFYIPKTVVDYRNYRTHNVRNIKNSFIKEQEKAKYEFALNENAQIMNLFLKRPHDLYISSLPGYILASAIKHQLCQRYSIKGCFGYLEFCGDALYLLLFDSKGALAFESQYIIASDNKIEHFTEIKMALRELTKTHQITLIVADGLEFLSNSIVQNPELNKDSRLRNLVGDARKSLFAFDVDSLTLSYDTYSRSLQDDLEHNEDKDSSSFDESDSLMPIMVSIEKQPILSELTLCEIFNRPVCLPKQAHTRPIRHLRNQKRIGLFSYLAIGGIVYGSIAGLLEYQSYQKQQEQERIRASQAPIVLDPYRAYREEIQNPEKNLQAYSGLMQTYAYLREFELLNNPEHQNRYNQEPSGWLIAQFKSEGRIMAFAPISDGGSRNQLNELSNNLGMRVSANSNGIQLYQAYQRQPIDQSVYMTRTEEEVVYINDAMRFLFDDLTFDISERVINGPDDGRYAVQLVTMNIKCWLPEDFMFAATQFTHRNISLHSINITNVLLSEENETCSYGYDGSVALQVFGK